MKIKISYSDDEQLKALEIENVLKSFLSQSRHVKIKKPEKKQPFSHIYLTVGKK